MSRCTFSNGTNLWAHRFVNWSPPDIFFRGWLLHNALVKGRSTCFRTRIRGQSTRRCYGSSGLVNKGVFVKGCDRRIANLGKRSASAHEWRVSMSILQWPHGRNRYVPPHEVLLRVPYVLFVVCDKAKT